MEGAVSIAQEEAADWGRGMAFHASTVAAIAAGLTAAAVQKAATARVRSEVAAAAQEARLAEELIVRKEAEVKALEEALAQDRQRRRRRKGPTPRQQQRPKPTPPGGTPSRPRDGRSLRRGPRRRRSWRRWKLRELGRSGLGKPRLPVPGKRPKGELPQPRPPQWRRRRPNFGVRQPWEGPEWRPFESSSKETPPPR